MKLRIGKIGLGTIGFLGFGPIIYPWVKEKEKIFAIKQAIVLWGWLGLILLIIFGVGIFYSFLVVQFPNIYQQYELEGWFLSISRKVLLCWLIFWFFGFIWAGIGIARKELPFVQKFMISKSLFAVVFISNLVLITIFISLFSLWCWSNILLRDVSKNSTPIVYVLYDDLDYLPKWIFDIGFFPVIRASVNTYGKGSVVIQVVNKKNLSNALRHAHILLLATHGTEEGILSKEGLIKPSDIKHMEKNSKLKYVYLSGCKGGVQKTLWKDAFYPAEVFTYSRMTATFEHIMWFWCSAPKLIKGEKIVFADS